MGCPALMVRTDCSPWDLEQALDSAPFAGFGIGSFVNHYAHCVENDLKPWRPVRDLVKLTYHGMRRWRARVPAEWAAVTDAIVVVRSESGVRHDELVKPVLDELVARGERVVMMCFHGTSDEFVDGAEYINGRDLLWIGWPQWCAAVARSGRHWPGRIWPTARCCLPAGSLIELVDNILEGTRWLISAQTLLTLARPRLLITYYDRGRYAAPFAMAARQAGVPTATFVHGTVGRSFVPLLADVAMCWGDRQVAEFVSRGTSIDRLVIGGNAKVPGVAPGRKAFAGLESNNIVVKFGTTPSGMVGQQLALVDQFCAALDGLSGVIGVVREHPKEPTGRYTSVTSHYPSIRVESANIPLDVSLEESDVVVTHMSGFGNDGLLRGRVCIQMRSTDVQGVDIGENGMADRKYEAHSAKELRALVERARDDNEFRAGWLRDAASVATAICKYRDGEAARHSASFLLTLCR